MQPDQISGAEAAAETFSGREGKSQMFVLSGWKGVGGIVTVV